MSPRTRRALLAALAASALGAADCLTAARVDDRWVIGRWSFAGYGDGAAAVNESFLSLVALVGGAIVEVGRCAADDFDRPVGSAQLNLSSISHGPPRAPAPRTMGRDVDTPAEGHSSSAR